MPTIPHDMIALVVGAAFVLFLLGVTLILKGFRALYRWRDRAIEKALAGALFPVVETGIFGPRVVMKNPYPADPKLG